MAIKLQDEDERITVTDVDLVGSDGDKETSYVIRPLTTDTHDDIRKKHTRAEWKRHVKSESLDELAFADALIDHVLLEWKGIVFKGQPVPCTLEYKKRLDAVRRSALLDKAGFNQIAQAAEQEEARKDGSFRATA